MNKSVRVDHIAIAVPSIANALPRLSKLLNTSLSETSTLTEHGVKVAFFQLANTKIELLEPLDDDSPIKRFLEKNPKGGIHHISLGVDDLDEAINRAKIPPIGKPRQGAHNSNVVFLDPRELGVLFELQSDQNQDKDN